MLSSVLTKSIADRRRATLISVALVGGDGAWAVVTYDALGDTVARFTELAGALAPPLDGCLDVGVRDGCLGAFDLDASEVDELDPRKHLECGSELEVDTGIHLHDLEAR